MRKYPIMGLSTLIPKIVHLKYILLCSYAPDAFLVQLSAFVTSLEVQTSSGMFTYFFIFDSCETLKQQPIISLEPHILFCWRCKPQFQI